MSGSKMLKGAVLVMALTGSPAMAAVQCWVNGAVNMNFGDVGYRTPTDVWSSVPWACQVPWNAQGATYHIRLCHFIRADTAMPGVGPRFLRHWDGSLMRYDLYHDAARTLLTGPPDGPQPVETWVAEGASNTQTGGALMLYGRVPAGQGELSTGVHESHFQGGVLRWRWSRVGAPSEAACRQGSGGEGGGEVSYFLNVQGTSREACFIRTVTPVDFGVRHGQLAAAVDQTGQIEVRCPLSTAWTLTLNGGEHSAGGQRRMMNARGDLLTYDLYRDAGRTQPWGGSGYGVSGTGRGLSGVSVVPVYGRVPAQPVVSAGDYSDTVTVSLTY